MTRDAALVVPNTPEGRLYRALPQIVAMIAQKTSDTLRNIYYGMNKNGVDLGINAAEHLAALLWTEVGTWPFSDVQQAGVDATLARVKALPIFRYEPEQLGQIRINVDFAIRYPEARDVPLPVIPRENGYRGYSFAPGLALMLLGRAVDRSGELRTINEAGGSCYPFYDKTYGVVFSHDVLKCLVGAMEWQARGFDPVQGNYSHSEPIKTFVYSHYIAQANYGQDNPWFDLPQYQTVQTVTVQEWVQGASYDSPYDLVDVTRQAYTLNPEYSVATAYPWCTNLMNWPIGFLEAYAEIGRQLWSAELARRKAKRKAERYKIIAGGLAIFGIGAAISAIVSSGVTVLNVASLVASVDNLPGVDLGPAGDIAKIIKLEDKLMSNLFDIGADDFTFDAGSFDTGLFDPNDVMVSIADFDLTLPDISYIDDFGIDNVTIELPSVDISPIDIPPSVENVLIGVDIPVEPITFDDIGIDVVNFDPGVFSQFGVDPTVPIDDGAGNLFTVTGEAVKLSPDAYLESFYVDELGNVRDFANNVVATYDDLVILSDAEGQALLAETIYNRGGQSFVSDQAAGGRPSTLPPAAGKVEVPWFVSLAEVGSKIYATFTQFSLAKEQIKKTGRYTPAYPTSAYGTPRAQVPGVPVQRADGSTVVNNGNGTQTIQYADGRIQTTPVAYTPSGFAAGGALIPGVSNTTLLLAGTGIVAAFLLARRT